MTKLKNIQNKSIYECLNLLSEARKLLQRPIHIITDKENERIDDIHEIVNYNVERLLGENSPISHIDELLAGQMQRRERIGIMRTNKDWSNRERCFVRSSTWFD